jgi:DNA-binding SARP family transcriptional activator
LTELHVDLLGGLRVRRAGGSEIRVASRKAQAVLVCLALRPGAAYSRDLLSSLLWEDSDPELARSSLRQALAALRRSLPEELAHALQGDAKTVALDPALVASDVSRFRALPRRFASPFAEVAERHVAHCSKGSTRARRRSSSGSTSGAASCDASSCRHSSASRCSRARSVMRRRRCSRSSG